MPRYVLPRRAFPSMRPTVRSFAASERPPTSTASARAASAAANCWLEVISPKLVLLKSVFRSAPNHAVENVEGFHADVQAHRAVSLIDLARLMFSVRFQGRRTSPFIRGALPSSPTGCTNAALSRNRSTIGSNSSPAIGARQSAPVTFGRLVPLKMFSGRVGGHADREPAAVGLDHRDAPAAEDLIGDRRGAASAARRRTAARTPC